MTRYIVILSPIFKKPGERRLTVETLKDSWRRSGQPQMAERRTVSLEETTNAEVRRLYDEWLYEQWGTHLKETIRLLDVVTISDPVWANNPELHEATLKAMKTGFKMAGGSAPPRHCFIGIEAEKV